MGHPFTVLAPTFINHPHYPCDRYPILLKRLQESGCKIIYSDRLDPHEIEHGKLLAFRSIEHTRTTNAHIICDLPHYVKVGAFFSDIDLGSTGKISPHAKYHHWAMEKVVQRCDFILTPYLGPFLDKWPQAKDKLVLFPQYYSPESRYLALPYNEDPIMKCISWEAPGHTALYRYRRQVAQPSFSDLFDIAPHPGYSRKEAPAYANDAYAAHINQYFAGFAECTPRQYVVGKYIEIPAAGALLVAEYCPDLPRLGFVHGVNYIKVSKTTIKKRVKDILTHPEKYEAIRRAGNAHALQNFGMEERLKTIKELMSLAPQTRSLPPGTYNICQGDADTALAIMRSGELLITHWGPELEALGLQDGLNCVRVTPSNAQATYKDAQNNPALYDRISARGHRFALQQGY